MKNKNRYAYWFICFLLFNAIVLYSGLRKQMMLKDRLVKDKTLSVLPYHVFSHHATGHLSTLKDFTGTAHTNYNIQTNQTILEEKEKLIEEAELFDEEELLAEEKLIEVELIEEEKLIKEQKMIEEEKLIEGEKLIEEKKLNKEKLIVEDKMIEEEKLVEEEKLNKEKLIEEKKLIEEEKLIEGEKLIKENKLIEENQPLDYIPSVIDASKNDRVLTVSDKIARKYLDLPEIQFQETIAILTPIRNSERVLDQYRSLVRNLTYPHHLLSVYFGEDGSTDKSFDKANTTAFQLKSDNNFKDAKVVRLNISGGVFGPAPERHEEKQQHIRRAHMALARNRLLRFALQQNKFNYTLWIDSDVTEFPRDLVQQMLFAKSDVVATSCLTKIEGNKMIYDKNSWRETNSSVSAQSKLEIDSIMLEGYKKSLRIFLPGLRAEGRVVPLDGVGGCALMVKADCFRSGLQFPEVLYKHHIETEGLAKMARDMGFKVVGLPFVEVFHE